MGEPATHHPTEPFVASYTTTDKFGDHTVSVRAGTMQANRTLCYLIREHMVPDASAIGVAGVAREVFKYLHGHSDHVPLDTWCRLIEETSLTVLCRHPGYVTVLEDTDDVTHDQQRQLQRAHGKIVVHQTEVDDIVTEIRRGRFERVRDDVPRALHFQPGVTYK